MLTVLDLGPLDMAGMMQELATNFGNKKDLAKKSDLWYDKLQRYPLAVVRRVVDRLLCEDTKYWPTLGHALAVARELAPTVDVAVKTPRLAFHDWERDPWANVHTLDHDRLLASSLPCPICGSVVQFASRGAVIVHDDAMHTEARVSYSNFGKMEWFSMPAPEYPEKKRSVGTALVALLPKEAPE